MENISKTEIFLLILIGYLFFRVVRELALIRLHAFIIKLKAEGKLRNENDPNNIEEKSYNEVLKHAKSIF